MIGYLPTQALAFLAVFVYATQAIAFEWKPGFRLIIFYSNKLQGFNTRHPTVQTLIAIMLTLRCISQVCEINLLSFWPVFVSAVASDCMPGKTCCVNCHFNSVHSTLVWPVYMLSENFERVPVLSTFRLTGAFPHFSGWKGEDCCYLLSAPPPVPRWESSRRSPTPTSDDEGIIHPHSPPLSPRGPKGVSFFLL